MTFLISIAIIRGIKQKIIIVLGNDLDSLAKGFMMVQITITASIIPVGSIYIHTVSDFNFLVYGASALMLISNIDNYFGELFRLQLEKNHKDIVHHKTYLQFPAGQKNMDVAYWWVIILTIANLINALFRCLVNKFTTCPFIEELKESHDNGDGFYFSSSGAKALEIISAALIILELLFMTLPFVSIPLVKKIVEQRQWRQTTARVKVELVK